MFNWLFPKKTPKQKRAYQGAVYNRLTADWVTSGTSADSEILGNLRSLRNRSRDLVRNNDYAKNAIRTICNNVIGKGISLQSQVHTRSGNKLDEGVNQRIEELWLDWTASEYCHTAGVLGFQEIEQLIIKSLVESGEVLIRLVRRPFGGSPVPLAIEIIESDQLADEYTSGTNRMGIEVDEWQRPIAYWLYPNHPGDYSFSGTHIGDHLLRVDASEIIHLFICDRPGQSRGVPWFHSALLRLRNIGGYEEAEIIAARAQASVMGFIQSPDSEFFGTEENGQRVSKLAPGAIETLQPGETFAGFAPTRPNQGFDPFVRCMLRGVAAGIGMSYEALSRDYSNTSYSSARTALIDERDSYRVLQTWLIRKFHKRVFKTWLEMAYLSGAIRLDGYELNPLRFRKDKWVARGWQWVDPKSEVDAYKEAIKAGFTTISEVVAQTGLDVEDVFKERRRELDLASGMELKFDTQLDEDRGKEAEGRRVAQSDQGSVLATEQEEKVDLQKMFGDRSIHFPTSEKRAKNCKKGKSCGNSCISQSKNCKADLSPAATAASNNPVAKNAGKVQKSKVTTTPKKTNNTTIKTNDQQLKKKRDGLVKKYGSKLVEDAENNTHKVLKDADLFVRVKQSSSLEKILGDRFKTSAELGTTDHDIPFLVGDYQTARNRVESQVLGYDAKTKPEDRPIYGYLGGKDLKGKSHADIEEAYGSIALKLKPEVKDRATFTGADSFKSGIASEVNNAGSPPPPNAASLVSSTRHGYDKSKLPSHYPKHYSSTSGDRGQLEAAAKAKTIDDLVKNLSPTGNAYMESQIHGGLKFSDIGEIHFTAKDQRPTTTIAQFALDNNIPLYINGKKANLQKIIADPKNDFANRNKHSPSMSEADATEYAKNGVYSKKTFYHGTGSVGGKSISTYGVDISLNTTGLYGQGFYTGGTQSIAKAYASSANEPTVLKVKLDIRNPKKLRDKQELNDLMSQNNINPWEKEKITAMLQKEGYDGVVIKEMNFFVAFEPKQVVVFDSKRVRK